MTGLTPVSLISLSILIAILMLYFYCARVFIRSIRRTAHPLAATFKDAIMEEASTSSEDAQHNNEESHDNYEVEYDDG